MAINRNFIVKQGIQVGANATIGSTLSSNQYISNKNDVLSVPAINLNFTRGIIDSRVRCERNSASTYVDQNGKIQLVANNTPRVEYDPTTGVCAGLVCEEQRTNYSNYSDIEGSLGSYPRGMGSAGIWPDQGPFVSNDVWIGPNKQSCKHVRGPTGGGDNNVGYVGTTNFTTINTFYTASVYVYIPSSSNVTLCAFGWESNGTQNPNLNANANLSIRDKWQRLTATSKLITAGTYFLPVLRIDPIGAIVYSDCWQGEVGEYASTWIPTDNVGQATRAADKNFISLANIHNPLGFTVAVEATTKWTANSLFSNTAGVFGYNGSNRHFWGMDITNGPTTQYQGTPYNGYGAQLFPGVATYALSLNSREYGNTTIGFASSGTLRVIQIANTGYNYSTITANTIMKLAYKVDQTQPSVFLLNGNTANYPEGAGSVYSNNITVDRLLIGMGVAGGTPPLELGGNVRKISLFSRTLSNNEITALSET